MFASTSTSLVAAAALFAVAQISTVSAGPITCLKTYYSVKDDTCQSIGDANALTPQQVHDANTFLNCEDIWAGTPICIPQGSASTVCKSTYYSEDKDNCQTIGEAFGMTAAEVKAANDFINCDDIWTGTPICITTDEGCDPDCATTVFAGDHETCASIAGRNGVSAGDILNSNDFVNCNDIWAGTLICVPSQKINTSSACTQRFKPTGKTTCKDVASTYGTSAGHILAWNSWVNCEDIWAGTDLCVAH